MNYYDIFLPGSSWQVARINKGGAVIGTEPSYLVLIGLLHLEEGMTGDSLYPYVEESVEYVKVGDMLLCTGLLRSSSELLLPVSDRFCFLSPGGRTLIALPGTCMNPEPDVECRLIRIG